MGYRGRRVVVFVPYGRERTVSILAAYLRREAKRGIIDHVMLCMNTDADQDADRRYAAELEATSPDLFKTYRRPGMPGWENDAGRVVPTIPLHWPDAPLTPKQMNTGRFFVYMQEPDTFYVRFDDDVIWVHPDAITAMIDAKLDRHPEAIAIFPIIWNNAVSTWILQENGRLPSNWPRVGPGAVDPVGWADPLFAERLHSHLLERLEAGIEDPVPIDYELGWRQQFSVSCFAIEGREYAACDGVTSYAEEEHWLTMHHTGNTGRSNWVTAQAMVAHWTFFTQAAYLNSTGLLERYRALAP